MGQPCEFQVLAVGSCRHVACPRRLPEQWRQPYLAFEYRTLRDGLLAELRPTDNGREMEGDVTEAVQAEWEGELAGYEESHRSGPPQPATGDPWLAGAPGESGEAVVAGLVDGLVAAAWNCISQEVRRRPSLAMGESFMKYASPLNVLKDTYVYTEYVSESGMKWDATESDPPAGGVPRPAAAARGPPLDGGEGTPRWVRPREAGRWSRSALLW
jgi:hypothetical protein